jgi:hypothetical protein
MRVHSSGVELGAVDLGRATTRTVFGPCHSTSTPARRRISYDHLLRRRGSLLGRSRRMKGYPVSRQAARIGEGKLYVAGRPSMVPTTAV